jgi:hypothetical protein
MPELGLGDLLGKQLRVVDQDVGVARELERGFLAARVG